MELKGLLHQYIQNPRDIRVNFDLGWKYEQMGQTASACSFYLRVTEFGNDLELSYEALLRMALCFEKQGNRWFMIKGLILRAISLLPKRVEGYNLLVRAYERNREWQEGYSTAVMADTFQLEEGKTITDLEYPGKWVFEFEKGVCGYWIGIFDESVSIFRKLIKMNNMPWNYKQAVENNLNLYGGNWKEPSTYYKHQFQKLRYKFEGSELIERNYSQSYQDLFVLMALNGKRWGSWIEIGCAHPTYGNNTFLLERDFDWEGVSIDIDENVESTWVERATRPYIMDATKIDWDKMPIWDLHSVTDYLQIDADPPHISYEILQKIPFWKHKFRVITFEHDYYVDDTIRDKSRKYLESFGYELIVSDVGVDDYSSYEDWWVLPELIDPKILKLLKSKGGINRADKYIFGEI